MHYHHRLSTPTSVKKNRTMLTKSCVRQAKYTPGVFAGGSHCASKQAILANILATTLACVCQRQDSYHFCFGRLGLLSFDVYGRYSACVSLLESPDLVDLLDLMTCRHLTNAFLLSTELSDANLAVYVVWHGLMPVVQWIVCVVGILRRCRSLCGCAACRTSCY